MKHLITCCLLLCSLVWLPAQDSWRDIVDNNPDQPFYRIVDMVEDFYADRDKGRGSGYKQFQRWVYFNSRRLNAKGYLVNVSAQLLDEYLFYRSSRLKVEDLNYDCSWAPIGGQAYDRVVSGHNGGLGRVNVIVPDPADAGTLYAGTPVGGLWRSTSAGGWSPGTPGVSFWEPLSDGLPNIGVSGIAIDPTSPPASRTIYILTGDGDGRDNRSIGVLKSLDGGQTWCRTGLQFTNNNNVWGYKLVMHPTDPQTLLAVTTRGIHRTTDGGVTWTLEQNNFMNEPFYDIEYKPNDANTLYAVQQRFFWRSTDGGDTWNQINCGLTFTGVRMAVAVTPDEPEYVYVLSGGTNLDPMLNLVPGTFRGLYRSTDGGTCFTMRSNTPNILDGSTTGNDTRQQAAYDLALAVNPADGEQVHVGGINTWRSGDGGQTWTQMAHWNEISAGAGNYNHADVHELTYIGNTLYSGSDGGVWRSANDGDDWDNRSQGLKITQYYAINAFTDNGNDYVMGGTQDNGLNSFEDSGAGFGNLQHWEGADGFEVSVDPVNDFAYGATQNGDIHQWDYTAAGFSTVSNTALHGGGAWSTPHTFDLANDQLIVGFTDLWALPTGGAWTNLSSGQIGANLSDYVVQSALNPGTIYVSKSGGGTAVLWRTRDGGATWNNITNTLPAANVIFTGIALDPADSERLWVTVSGFQAGNKVYFSPDGGDNWTNISGTLPNLSANTVVYQPGSADGLYVGMDVGVYYRDNTLTDWVLFSNELPNTIITQLEINPSTSQLYAGTYGRGAWVSDLYSACNRVCLNCPDFSGLQSPSNVYSSESCITSTAEIHDSTSIVYEAEDYILLGEKFHARSSTGAIFHGLIQTCDPAPRSLPAVLINLQSLPGFLILEPDEAYNPQRGRAAEMPFTASVYPNPADHRLTLDFELEQEGYVDIYLYDIYGRQRESWIEHRRMEAGNYQRSWAVDHLPSGTYLLEFGFRGLRTYLSVVIQRE